MLKFPYWITKSRNLKNELLIFNWKTNQSVIIFDINHPIYSADEVNVIDENLIYNSQFLNDIIWLKDNNFLIDVCTEQLPLISLNKSKDDSLHLILLPAGEACNLDCVYCYEDHADKSRMNEYTAETLYKFIKNTNAKSVQIEYFGGEPLLNIKFIESMAKTLSENKILFNASITTNGTLLTESIFLRLYNSGVRSFQITLDGASEIHNKLRISKSKNLDSFYTVSKGIRTVLESDASDISLIIRTNVNINSVNEKYAANFISVIRDIVPVTDARVVFFPKPIGDYSALNLKSNIKSDDVHCKHGTGSAAVEKMEQLIFEAGYTLADPILMTKLGGYSCYAGKSNSFVITPDLKVRKCTVALDDPVNFVGNIDSTGVFTCNENFIRWEKNYSDKNCKQCYAQLTCQGNSCPLENIKTDSKHCPPLKLNGAYTNLKVVNFYERLSSD